MVHKISPIEISSLLGLSEKTVRRYLRLFERTGDVQPSPRRNGPTRLLGDHEQLLLLQFILERPGIYLYEIKNKMQGALGVSVSESSICRTLKFMGCSRQVIRHVAIQRSDAMRAKFMAEVSMYDPSMFVWTDESSCDKRNSMRKYGYSVKGIPPVEHRFLVRGTRYSAIPVMSVAGIHELYLAEGNINGDRFSHFIRDYLLSVLQPYNGVNPSSIVIMDNASIHHVDANVRLIENAQSKLIFLPPYSPDLNPLEPVFGKVKTIMKENDQLFQVCSAPRALLTMAFAMISPEDCKEFSRHCGYLI